MSLELTCLTVTLPLPTIPIINNMTSVPRHSDYNPNGKAISQLISSSLARSTFSTADIQSLLTTMTSGSLDVSTIVNSKPITSTIIYTSVTLALFLVLSSMFYILSCVNCGQRKSPKKKQFERKCKCSGRRVCFVLLLVVGLIVISQMIYIAYQVSRTTRYLDESIKEINQEIYPKDVSLHLKHLLQQIQSLDEYSTRMDSIVIQASRLLLIKAFNQILREQYSLDIIGSSIIDSDKNIKELNVLIDQDSSLPSAAKSVFEEIRNQHQGMIESLQVPLQELCEYANGSEMEIDKTILHALNLVHEQMIKLNETVEKYFLTYLTPWEDAMIMNRDFEDQIRRYVRLVGIILLVLVIIFGLIPIGFFLVIVLYRCWHEKRKNPSSKYNSRR